MSCPRASWTVLLLAALVGGCAAGSKPASGGSGSGGEGEEGGASGSSATGGKSGTGGSSGSQADAGGFPATDAGSAAGGAGGGAGGAAGSAGGTGGSPGTGGAGGFPADAGPGPPPPPPPPPPPCSVSITPVSPQRLDGLPVGSKLRVEATAHGEMAPKTPAWQWKVVHQNTGMPITTTVVEMNAGVVEFPLAAAGNYDITATAAMGCQNGARATAVTDPVASFWLRVTPPAGANVQPMEKIIVDVPAGRAVTRDLALGIGFPVSIDPQNETGMQAIFSYVRITGEGSTMRLEGHTGRGQFNVRLNSTLHYDVLIIPDSTVAPLLFRGTPAQIVQNPFKLDPGVAINGTVSSASGPVPNARVLLRAGVVPSTTGVVQSNGQFDMRARPGTLAAVIIPPPKSGLPEARLSAGEGLNIYETLPARVSLDFVWAPISTATLDLTVVDSAGMPVKGPVRVRLESAENALPRVGTLTLDKQFELPTRGFVQQTDTSDARGALTFTGLPRAAYTATLTPIDGSAAITTVAVDLSGSMTRVAQTARLGAKVSLTGKLSPAALTAGAKVVALDAAADPAVPPPSAIVDATGTYVLRVDPGRSYSLVMEAVPARTLPRTFLRAIVAPAKDSVREEMTVPTGVPLSGIVTDNGGMPVAGALVEAYCIGRPPSCIDGLAPDTTSVRPTAEAISDGSGAYRLVVPDPKIAN
jgi:hypothetical protein